jgi:hypothetical protein
VIRRGMLNFVDKKGEQEYAGIPTISTIPFPFCPSHLSIPSSFSQSSLPMPLRCPFGAPSIHLLHSPSPNLLSSFILNTTTNLNPIGSSSEMAIFCDSSLDWILECTSDPKGVSVLRAMGLRMGTKLNFSDKHLSGVRFCPSKDRPLWPLPDAELAMTYIDGMLCSEDPERGK